MRQLDWNRIDTERKLNMEIVSYRNNMAASSEQVVSNKENVMQAEKAVLIAGKRYDVGKGYSARTEQFASISDSGSTHL